MLGIEGYHAAGADGRVCWQGRGKLSCMDKGVWELVERCMICSLRLESLLLQVW